jgi:hypothetical protein
MRARVLTMMFVLALVMPYGARALPQEARLAVAPFSQPDSNWELLGGYLPEDAQQADPAVLGELDKALETALREKGLRGYTAAGETGRCEELVLSRLSGTQVSVLKYWRDVGICAGADYLLVPMLLDWRERIGGDLAVKQPARVVLDLYLIDIAEGEIIDRYHFEETQRSLSENLLDLPKFLKRGAQWVTAMELAREALNRGVEELGL